MIGNAELIVRRAIFDKWIGEHSDPEPLEFWSSDTETIHFGYYANISEREKHLKQKFLEFDFWKPLIRFI